jgi:hypothetical protein
VASHEGQGNEVTTDPEMVLTLTIDGQLLKVPVKEFSIYESRPNKDGSRGPQGFELEADGVMIAGQLPSGLNVAPSRKFQQLVGQTLQIQPGGGDPTYQKLTKVTLANEKVYRGVSGTIAIKNAFYHGDRYAGVSGDVQIVLQEIKLGDAEDPKNREDKPIGEPKTATGTFSSRAASYRFQQM